MGYPLRNCSPDLVHHIVVKTYSNEINLVDYGQINDMIGGVLARYQEMLGILIFAFCFNGNHFHIVAQAPNRNLEAFMQYVLREISRRMRRILSRVPDQPFWSKRYSDQLVPTAEDEFEVFLYTSTNAVKHGLETSMAKYPGFNSLSIQRSSGKKEFGFTHYSKKTSQGGYLVSMHTLTISKLPQLKNPETSPEFITELNEAIMLREAEIAKLRDFKPSLGRAYLLQQVAGKRPLEINQKRRPTIYTKSKNILIEWRIKERERKLQYEKLSAAYRLSNVFVEFPPDCYPPARIKKPNQHLQLFMKEKMQQYLNAA